MMFALFALAITAAPAPTAPVLHVRAVETTGAPCAAHSALLAALQRDLPTVEVTAGGEVVGEDLAVAVAYQGERGWRLEVFRTDGSAALTRMTPPGVSCAVAADTWTLILERFFDEVGWSGRSVEVAPVALPPTPVTATSFDEPRPLPKSPPARSALTMTVGAGGWAAVGTPLHPVFGVAVEGALRLGDWFRPSLLIAGGRSLEQNVVVGLATRGNARVWTGRVLATGTACSEVSILSACGGVAAGAEVTHASASGSRLYRLAGQAAAIPAGGLIARVSVPIAAVEL